MRYAAVQTLLPPNIRRQRSRPPEHACHSANTPPLTLLPHPQHTHAFARTLAHARAPSHTLALTYTHTRTHNRTRTHTLAQVLSHMGQAQVARVRELQRLLDAAKARAAKAQAASSAAPAPGRRAGPGRARSGTSLTLGGVQFEEADADTVPRLDPAMVAAATGCALHVLPLPWAPWAPECCHSRNRTPAPPSHAVSPASPAPLLAPSTPSPPPGVEPGPRRCPCCKQN